MHKLRHIHSKVGSETAFRIPVSVEDAIAEAVEAYDQMAARVERLEKCLSQFRPFSEYPDGCFEYAEGSEHMGDEVSQLLEEPPAASLLIHDAGLLESFYAQEDARGANHGPGWFIWPQRLLDEADRLRKQADALEGEG
jgi:hypothetical protein